MYDNGVVDQLTYECEALVVADKNQPYPMAIGRKLLDQPQIRLEKPSKNLSIVDSMKEAINRVTTSCRKTNNSCGR